MRHKKIFSWILVICAALLLLDHALVVARIIVHDEEDVLSGRSIAVVDAETYDDNTIVLRIHTVDTGSADDAGLLCYDPEMRLRLVHSNGSVAEIPLDFKFPLASRCIDLYYPYYPDGFTITPLAPGFLMIQYFDAEDIMDPETFSEYRMLIKWNGDIVERVRVGKAALEEIDGVAIATHFVVVPNTARSNGMIFLFERNDETSGTSYFEWQQYKAQDPKNGTLTRLKSGKFVQDNSHVKLWSTAFAAHDGGYVLISAYEREPEDDNPLRPVAVVQSTFFDPDTNITHGPFILYESVLRDSFPSDMDCGNSPAGVGYFCVGQVAIETNETREGAEITVQRLYYLAITFLSSGSVTNQTVINVIDEQIVNAEPDPNEIYHEIVIAPMAYGGYILSNTTTIELDSSFTNVLLDNSGEEMDVDIGRAKNVSTFGGGTAVSDSLSNNVWFVAFANATYNEEDGTLTNHKLYVQTYDIPKLWEDKTGVHNPNIDGLSPKIGASLEVGVTTKISIEYNVEIRLAEGNLSIYQFDPENPDSPLLRQRVTETDLPFADISDSRFFLNITTMKATFNKPDANYYVEIDPGFVEQRALGEAISGIEAKRWTFRTEAHGGGDGKFSDSVTGLFRLNTDMSAEFLDYSSDKREEYYDQLYTDLLAAIPIERDRLSTEKKYQIERIDGDKYVLLSFTIGATRNSSQRTSEELRQNVDELVQNSDVSSMSVYESTQKLDATYGFQTRLDIWEKYKIRLLILFLVVLVLLALFVMARIRHNEGNNWAIIQIAMVLMDFALDIAFLANNGRDVSYLFIPCIIFLAVPLSINCCLAFYLFTYEHDNNKSFLNWSNKNIKLAPAFTLLAAVDIEILNVLASRLAALNLFCAPISDRSLEWIFWAGTVNIFIEDIPQLIIQIMYRENTVSYDFIPFLTLIMSSIMVTINVLQRLYSIIHFFRTSEVRFSIPPDVLAKREFLDEQDRLGVADDAGSTTTSVVSSTSTARRKEGELKRVQQEHGEAQP